MDVFADAIKKLDRTAKLIREDVSFLHEPEKILITSFPARIGGKTIYLKGYRVQYNSLLGPTKGGLRFAPQVDLSEVKALALWMTLKNSLAGIPYGGAKGGVAVNTKELSKEELENVTRSFARSISRFIGSDIDIPAPDVYTNPQVMAWLLDEYEALKGKHEPAVVTGKPLILGGSKGRDKATARGCYFIIKEVLKKGDIIIQGFGNAGRNLALMLFDDGYKIVGISDSKGGIYDPDGISVPELIKHKEKTGSVKGFKGKQVTNSELLELQCDALVPAAVENVITKENAGKIKAKLIFELANGPVSDEADSILSDAKIYPDILCNAGGVIVSYLEWVQNRQGYCWEEKEVNEKLKERMITNLHLVQDEAKNLNCTLRQAAYSLAIKRLISAKQLRNH